MLAPPPQGREGKIEEKEKGGGGETVAKIRGRREGGREKYKSVDVLSRVPYTKKFSRSKIFAAGLSQRISRVKSRGLARTTAIPTMPTEFLRVKFSRFVEDPKTAKILLLEIF